MRNSDFFNRAVPNSATQFSKSRTMVIVYGRFYSVPISARASSKRTTAYGSNGIK